MGSPCADLIWDTLAAPFGLDAKAVPMSYGGQRRARIETLILVEQRVHLLTAHLPKPRLASGNTSGRMMSPEAAWPWSKGNQFGSDAGWQQ
jgi:hypothetical protein